MAKKKTENAKKENASRLVLLDSHAILHRAYHAIPELTSADGEPAGALYGLVSMLLKLIDDLEPDYLIATRDLPGATHRHEMFEAYKATRMKTDDALITQLERAPKVFEAFGIPLYQYPGFEADDILGTIMHEIGPRSDIETIIASGDMDTMQLVSPNVSVYTMRKGLSDTILYDEDAVEARYGFGPNRVIDFKALSGDPSDNIPGVKGIGEKTATELIQKFGSLEEIYRALEKGEEKFIASGAKPRTAKLLTEGKADAFFSKTLATIRGDAPISFELPPRRWHLSDHVSSIADLCDEMGFRSLKERVRGAVSEVGEQGEGSGRTGVASAPAIDPVSLRETSLALWLLRSDITNPTQDDILDYAKTEDFERARETIFAQLRSTGRLMDVFEKIEKPLMPIVARMNEDGIFVDVGHLKSLNREYGKALAEITGRIFARAGHEFNLNSPKQLAAVLYDELNIVPAKFKKTASGARTTREEELVKLSSAHPIIADILAYRELQKLLGTYIEKMPGLVGKDGRLHAEFLQAGTTTGRMSSQNPNLQNIPVKSEHGRRIREAFAAPQGSLIVSLDYSQIELRIAAALSGDEKLIRIFKEGGDVHAAAAAEVFGVPPEHVDREMRRRAKVINFGILYGMGVNALRANLGEGVSREEAADYLSQYFKNFSGLARYIEAKKAEAAAQGYTETMFGRRRYFSGFKSALPNLRAQAERMAINAPIQGTQADIIKLAMIEADKLIEKNAWRGKVKLVLQVHDELVYEIERGIAQEAGEAIRSVMESVAPKKEFVGVPIIAEIATGPNWGDVRKSK